jgi:hypothetical protein
MALLLGSLEYTTAWAGESSSVVDTGASEFGTEESQTGISANYYAIFYGPSIQDPNGYQPTRTGVPDPDKPVLMKNFIDLGYGLSDTITVAADAYWTWQPYEGSDMTMQDPLVKISDSGLITAGDFNLYGDLRVHMPVTQTSRINDLLVGLQSVQVAFYSVPKTDLMIGLYSSERTNVFGTQGYGNDLELYVGPNVHYRLTDNFSLCALYDFNWNHVYGERAWLLHPNGQDIEPGFEWDVTKTVSVNPYLNFLTGGPIQMKDTSFGFIFNWKMI